jgi:predicted nucleic acid-binding protein
MSVFIDTNILLRIADPADPKHEISASTISDLIEAGESLCITPQIAAEFWNAATRPVKNNGLAMTPDEARDELTRLEGFFSMLDESADVYAEWKRLVSTHAVLAVKAHDARIVAAMNVYGIRRIVTFNVADFRRYDGIEIITPA